MRNHNSNNHDYRKEWEKRSYWIVLGIAAILLIVLAFAIVHAKAQTFENNMRHTEEVISRYEERQKESNRQYMSWLKEHHEYDENLTTEAIVPETTEESTKSTTVKSSVRPKALALENKEFISAPESVTEVTTTEVQIEPEATTETTEEDTEDEWTDNEIYAMDDDEIDLLCRIVNAENGSAPDWVIQYTAQVILNRVKSNEFPNNISDVVSQVDYVDGEPIVQYETYWNGAANEPASERVIDNVLSVIENGTDLPSFVIGQSMNIWNGCYVYCEYDSPDGPEFFFWWED